MRSIVEEASTIQKAVDAAWNKAEQPSEFTVKILELPQYSFFGLTKRSAKIALFFEAKAKKVDRPRADRSRTDRPRADRSRSGRPTQKRPSREAATPRRQTSDVNKREAIENKWNEKMIAAITQWLSSLLKLMNMDGAKFSCQAKQRVLFVSFAKPLLDSRNKDQRLLMNISHLALKALRIQFGQETRHLKIIFQVAQ